MKIGTPYLDRYLAGEREAVWSELIGLDERVRVSPLFDDALAVAREIVRRSRRNIELIYHRPVLCAISSHSNAENRRENEGSEQ